VAVSGMTVPGTVTVDFKAGVVKDQYGNRNEASTSEYNTATYAP